MSDARNNRDAMPQVAALVDELRAQGLEVRVLYASENGHTRGKPPQDREVFDIPVNYRLPCVGGTEGRDRAGDAGGKG